MSDRGRTCTPHALRKSATWLAKCRPEGPRPRHTVLLTSDSHFVKYLCHILGPCCDTKSRWEMLARSDPGGSFQRLHFSLRRTSIYNDLARSSPRELKRRAHRQKVEGSEHVILWRRQLTLFEESLIHGGVQPPVGGEPRPSLMTATISPNAYPQVFSRRSKSGSDQRDAESRP